MLWIETARATHDRLRKADAGGVLGPGLPRLQGVQTYTCHDSREPSAQILDPVGSRAADAQPGILNGFIRLRKGAQHPIGHRSQVRAMSLEAFDEPFAFVHGAPPYSPLTMNDRRD